MIKFMSMYHKISPYIDIMIIMLMYDKSIIIVTDLLLSAVSFYPIRHLSETLS